MKVTGRKAEHGSPDPRHPDAGDHQARHEAPAIRGDLRGPRDIGDPNRKQAESSDQNVFRVAIRERRSAARHQDHRQRLRRDGQARGEGAQSKDGLVVDRHRQEDADDREAHREHDEGHQRVVPVLEDRERQQRLLVLAPPLHDEKEEQDGHAGRDDLGDRDPCPYGSPFVPLPLDQAEDDAEQSRACERDAGEIQSMTKARSQVRDEREREHERDQPDR